jgi:hypothetical protein
MRVMAVLFGSRASATNAGGADRQARIGNRHAHAVRMPATHPAALKEVLALEAAKRYGDWATWNCRSAGVAA